MVQNVVSFPFSEALIEFIELQNSAVESTMPTIAIAAKTEKA